MAHHLTNDRRLHLRIAPRAWEKLSLWIQLAEGEVGGLGSVVFEEGGFLITDCFLIDQRATDVDTELDPEATSRFLIDYLNDGGAPETLRLWWHSHGRESVFWSTDDERTIDHFGGESLVALVGNHRQKFLARFDRYEPRRETEGWLDVMPPAPPLPREGAAAEQARAELAARVTVVTRRTNKIWTDGDLPRPHA